MTSNDPMPAQTNEITNVEDVDGFSMKPILDLAGKEQLIKASQDSNAYRSDRVRHASASWSEHMGVHNDQSH